MKLQDKMRNKKTITSRELIQLLIAKGFRFERSNGDHKVYKKDDRTVTVNTRNLNRMVAMRLIKENDLLISDDNGESDFEDEIKNEKVIALG